jgi:hypothetical protein
VQNNLTIFFSGLNISSVCDIALTDDSKYIFQMRHWRAITDNKTPVFQRRDL